MASLESSSLLFVASLQDPPTPLGVFFFHPEPILVCSITNFVQYWLESVQYWMWKCAILKFNGYQTLCPYNKRDKGQVTVKDFCDAIFLVKFLCFAYSLLIGLRRFRFDYVYTTTLNTPCFHLYIILGPTIFSTTWFTCLRNTPIIWRV